MARFTRAFVASAATVLVAVNIMAAWSAGVLSFQAQGQEVEESQFEFGPIALGVNLLAVSLLLLIWLISQKLYELQRRK